MLNGSSVKKLINNSIHVYIGSIKKCIQNYQINKSEKYFRNLVCVRSEFVELLDESTLKEIENLENEKSNLIIDCVNDFVKKKIDEYFCFSPKDFYNKLKSISDENENENAINILKTSLVEKFDTELKKAFSMETPDLN